MEATIATRSNLEIIQQAFTDFANGRISSIMDICTDDVRWATYKVPGAASSGSFFGKEGIEEFFVKLGAEIVFSIFEPKDFIVQDNLVVVFGYCVGTVQRTGKSFSGEWCYKFRMAEGRVKEFFGYIDSYEQAKAFKA